ncbi:MAG: hypothetical protein JSU81_11075 [Candidatus Coatesbacteria bacterium]|nr:MAG: hypothetical protein JSU81_11075 [Candidatus Coatesbacteria bacterium]
MRNYVITIMLAAVAATPIAAKGTAGPYADAGPSGHHDDGLLWLKVWNTGSFGDRQYGSAIYPAPEGPANLYLGETWFGGLKDGRLHLAEPSFGWRPLTEVIMSDEPAWSEVPPYIKREGTLDSYYRMDDADAREGGPIPVTCDFHGMSWDLDEADDFIALRYHLTNDSNTPLEKTYLALAYDFDIGGSFSYIDDYVGFDADRVMPYMYDGETENSYLGLLCLDGTVRTARSWDIMNDPVTSLHKYLYISTPGFDECEQTTPYDWRFLLSVGPYYLRPSQTLIVTFALVAGADLEALQKNADTARAIFATGPPPKPKLPTTFNLSQNRPNPVTNSTRIEFACPFSVRVELAVYDVAGRRVATLAEGVYPQGIHRVQWTPVDVAPGVYVYALEAATERLVKTMVVAP